MKASTSMGGGASKPDQILYVEGGANWEIKHSALICLSVHKLTTIAMQPSTALLGETVCIKQYN